MRAVIVKILLFVLLGSIFGCSGYYHQARPEERSDKSPKKIRAEAYLFDARLRRQGKPTSFRLEIYQHDSATALSGRGYLGKGAMKGVIIDDSVLVYFPISHEYVYESIGNLIASSPCPEGVPYLNVMKLLSTLPDSLEDFEHVQITANYINPKRPEYIIYSRGCPWQLILRYDHRKNGWRLRHFVFDNGDGTTIKANRRKYKPNARVPQNRFEVTIPPDAERIIP